MFVRLLFFTFLLATCGCTSDMTPTDKVRARIIRRYARQMLKRGLYVAGGGGGQKDGKVRVLDVCLNIDQVLTIGSARSLVVASTQELIELINSSSQKQYFLECPVSERSLCVSIIGRKPECYREYIISVTALYGTVYYSSEDYTGKVMHLFDAYEESYEEAVKIVSRENLFSPARS